MDQFKPLDFFELSFSDRKTGLIEVRDGRGDIYFYKEFKKKVKFKIIGSCGWHKIIIKKDGKRIEKRIKVECETEIKTDSFIEKLFKKLVADCQTKKSDYIDGKIVNYYVRWIRDDTHCKKAYRYWEKELKSMPELFLNHQSKNGMIFDLFDESDPFFHYRQMVWGEKWAKYIDNNKFYMERIPVEADVEYLIVENVFYTWQATGDNEWLKKILPKLDRAMKYTMNDKLRWSKKFGLVKRGFTIDTWDFQPLIIKNIHPDGNKNKFGLFDFMWIDEKSPFFIFHGDNTGFYHSCLLLSKMFDVIKNKKKRDYWKNIALKIKKNLDKYCWNGKFYYHHIPAENIENFKIDSFDYRNQLSLSHSYDLNREIGYDKAVSIIKEYIELKEKTKEESFAEWFTVYPPFPEGVFHLNKGEYMNGGITTIVAGELSKAAFNNGFEWYGADILKRINDIIEKDGYLHCVYRPKVEKFIEGNFKVIDLKKIVNRATSYKYKDGWLGMLDIMNNDMRYLKPGKYEFYGIPYEIIDPEKNNGKNVLIVGKFLNDVEIEVNDFAGSVYFFHTGNRLIHNDVCGIYNVIYQDGSEEKVYLIGNKNITGWWNSKDTVETRVVWHGKGGKCWDVGFNVFVWNNPNPEKKIEKIKVSAVKNECQIIIFGITISDRKGKLPEKHISYGIPDNWGMTAVISSIIEGLCGIKDRYKLFEKVEISPKWESLKGKKADVFIKYGPNDSYIAYKYRKIKNRILIDFTGSGSKFYFHIMLPFYSNVKEVLFEGRPLKFEKIKVGDTFYVDFEIKDVKGGEIKIIL